MDFWGHVDYNMSNMAKIHDPFTPPETLLQLTSSSTIPARVLELQQLPRFEHRRSLSSSARPNHLKKGRPLKLACYARGVVVKFVNDSGRLV